MSTCGPVWLQLAEKESGVPSLTDDEAVGLCYGWISGQRKAYDVPSRSARSRMPRRREQVAAEIHEDEASKS